MGPTSSGKTQYLVNQLRGPFRGKVDHMVLIRPTFVHNRTYDGFKDNDSRMFAIDCPKEEVKEYKELMAKTCAIHLESNFLINRSRNSEQEALNEVMQMLEATPHSSKPSDLPVLLPAIKFQNNAKSWLCLFLQATPKRRFAPNFLMNS